ncbi:MAG: hypothetical protein ACR2LJ_13000 [Acidimicrobiales bacterium]
MPVAASVRFAGAVQALAAEVRRQGLLVPGFRSPPQPAGLERTIRRRPDGQVVIAVRLRGRPFAAVAVDMVEGILVANRVPDRRATGLRAALLAAVLHAYDARAA